MIRIVSTVAFIIAGTIAAQADARTESMELLNIATEARIKLVPAIETWDGVASKASEASLRAEVLEPLKEASDAWFEAGMKFGGGDDNPYQPFMACHDGAYKLQQQAIQLIHFHAGSWSAEKVTFDQIEPAIAKLDECLAAVME